MDEDPAPTPGPGNAKGDSLRTRLLRRAEPRTFGTAFTEDEFGEKTLRSSLLDAVPVVGAARDVERFASLAAAASAYNEGKADETQVQMLEQFIDFAARREEPGATAGSIVAGSLEALPSFVAGSGLATLLGAKFLKTAGGQAIKTALGKVAAKGITGKVAAGVATTTAFGVAATAGLDAVGEGARAIVGEDAAGPTRANAMQRLFQERYQLSTQEAGETVVTLREGAAGLEEIIPKAFFDSVTEFASEKAGSAFLALPKGGKLEALSNWGFQVLARQQGAKNAKAILAKAGVNGVFEELGEEVYGAGLSDFLAWVSGERLADGGQLEAFRDLEHVAEMALGIGISTGGLQLASGALGSVVPDVTEDVPDKGPDRTPITDPVSTSGVDGVHKPSGQPVEAPPESPSATTAPKTVFDPVPLDTPPDESGSPNLEVQGSPVNQSSGGASAAPAPAEAQAAPLASPRPLAASQSSAGTAAGTLPTGALTPSRATAKPKVAPKPAAPVTAPYNPLVAQAGNLLRTKDDSAKAIQKSITAARARRRANQLELEGRDNIYSVVRDLGNRFGVGRPGVGKVQSLATKANGFYRPGATEIRLRRGSYVGTFVHEVGHHVHTVLVPTLKRPGKPGDGTMEFPPEWQPDLRKLGEQLYGTKEPHNGYESEGWAEVFRFLVTNPAHLKKQTPELYKSVVGTLVRHHPETWISLQDARERVANSFKGGRENPVRQYIRRGSPPKNLRSIWDSVMGQTLNRVVRAQSFTRDLGLEALPADQDPHTAALRMDGHISGDVRIAYSMGRFDPADPRREKTGKSLGELLTPIKDRLDLWEEFQVARRTIEKRAQGFEVLPEDARLPTLADTKSLKAFIKRTLKEHPDFAQVSKEFGEFNRWLIEDYAVHYGLVTEAAAKLITSKNLEYITFRYDQVNDALRGVNGPRKGAANQSSGIRRFKNSKGEQLLPPLATFLGSMQSIMTRARQNGTAHKFTQHALKNTDGIGRWIRKIDRKVTAHKISAKDLSSEVLDQLGIEINSDGEMVLPEYLQDLTDQQLEDLLGSIVGLKGATFWKADGTPNAGENEITVLVGGKPVFFEVVDQQLYDLLTGLGNSAAAQGFLKLVGFPRRLLVAGATQRNVGFGIPNWTADMVAALTMTSTQLSNVSAQVRGRYAGIKAAWKGGDWARLYQASGADMSGIMGEMYDPKTQQLNMGDLFGKPDRFKLMKGETRRERFKDFMTLGWAERFNGFMERATRIGEFAVVYEEAKAKGRSEADAIAFAGQEGADITVDFQRGGTAIKQANQYIPFLNAAIVGGDKLRRFIQERPMVALGRMFSMTIIPTITMLLALRDDEEYWALPLSERDRHWHFPDGLDEQGKPHYLRVKKPYGLAVPSILVQRQWAKLWGINPESGKKEGDPRAMKGVRGALERELVPDFMNLAGLVPFLEVNVGEEGYSFFWERPIVPRSDQGLPKPQQGALRASGLGRAIGGLIDKSPAKVDYLVRNLTGGLGTDALRIMDPAMEAITGERGEASDFFSVSELPVIRRLIARAARGGHEALTRFWDDHTEFERPYKRLKQLEKVHGKGSREAGEYAVEHQAELELFRVYSKQRSKMGKRYAEIRLLYAREEDPDKLNDRVDEIYDELIALSRVALQYRVRVDESQ